MNFPGRAEKVAVHMHALVDLVSLAPLKRIVYNDLNLNFTKLVTKQLVEKPN